MCFRPELAWTARLLGELPKRSSVANGVAISVFSLAALVHSLKVMFSSSPDLSGALEAGRSRDMQRCVFLRRKVCRMEQASPIVPVKGQTCLRSGRAAGLSQNVHDSAELYCDTLRPCTECPILSQKSRTMTGGGLAAAGGLGRAIAQPSKNPGSCCSLWSFGDVECAASAPKPAP